MARWSAADLAASMSTRDALETIEDRFPDGQILLDAAEQLEDVRGLEREDSLALAMAVLLKVRRLTEETAPGFDELLDEGGAWRWSLRHWAEWIDHRVEYRLDELLADLLVALLNQHRRVALTKVRVLDRRDPFCIAEDNGLLTTIRSDDPFWTGARYGVVNHLLWTLGLLTSPGTDPRLTPLGHQTLLEMGNRDA